MVPLVLEVEVNGYFFIYLEFPSSLSSYQQLKIINGDVESFFFLISYSYFLIMKYVGKVRTEKQINV